MVFKKSAITVFCLLLYCFSTPSAFAKDFYVSPNGNDNNSGIKNEPWQTIGKAAETLEAGDTVYIMDGTYREQVIPVNSGSPGSYITYTVFPGHTATIDGNGLKLNGWGLFQISKKQYIRVSGLRVINSPSYGIGEEGSSHIVFENNYVYNTVNSGIIAAEFNGRNDHITIDSNEVELACNDGGQECISMAMTDVFEIKNNHVHHGGPGTNGGEGIDVKFGSSNGSIHHNHVHHMNRQGIYVDAWKEHTYNIEVFNNIVHDCNNQDGFDCCSEQGGLLENITFYNNIAYNNSCNGFRFASWGDGPMRNIKVINNTFFNNGGGSWGIRGGIAIDNPNVENIIIRNNICSNNEEFQIKNNVKEKIPNLIIEHNLIDGFRGSEGEIRGDYFIEDNPGFVNAAIFDFHLKPGSPAIDSGSAIDAPAGDIDETARPQGSGVDIGAYETIPGK
ncbi:right-handed parallel beta-helix repeat-containing protein [Candidatus Latescibacterota bacterium]